MNTGIIPEQISSVQSRRHIKQMSNEEVKGKHETVTGYLA
jgi:hypothetical protein